ncbi:MAG: sulfatase [Planctomycetota bacterium]
MPDPDPNTEAPRQGLGWSLRAGLGAGLVAALIFGVVDAALAWRGGPSLGLLLVLGCLGATVLLYAGLYGTLGLAAGAALHPLRWLGSGAARYRALLGLLLAAGIFLEVFWWTRPYVYPGVPVTSPGRLLVSMMFALGSLGVGALAARLLVGLPEAAHRAMRAALLLLGLVGAATMFLDHRAGEGSGRGELNERNRDLPNVLLIVVDALRADVLEPYGHPRVKTPHVKRLAERGVLFENAMVQAPYTWTSFGSILTGKYPRRHGLVVMAPSARMMRDKNVTLPWHLKHAQCAGGDRLTDGDFAGATFMTGTLSQGSGLMHGFDTYFEAMAGHELVTLDSRWSVFRSGLLVSLIKNKLTQRFDNSLVTSTAIDWMRRNEGKRFVAMLHLYSTHTPYDPEEEFRAQYCNPAYDGPVHAFYAEHRIALENGDYVATDADVEQIRNLYYAGAAQADRDVGLLLAELERQGVLDDTLVIFTSDHGEELAEHGLWEHNWMYQTNLQVPLVLSWPAGLEGGRRVAATVETVDILPTVCDLLGLSLPDEGDEYERVDGISLVPLMRGEAESVKRYSFAENGRFTSVLDGDWKLIVRAEVLSEPDGWEQALSGAIETPRLFHLAEDPGETVNLFNDAPDEAKRLFDVLAHWDGGMPIPRVEIVRSARDLENELLMEKLGYTDGATGATGFLEDGDPDSGGGSSEGRGENR